MAAGWDDPWRVEAEGLGWDDPRLAKVRDPRTPVSWSVPADRACWELRAAEVRRSILISAGLWPEPQRPPVRAEYGERVEGDGFSVVPVALETWPGVWLMGNLFRPAGATTQRRPAVLLPHGHWPRGRLEHSATCSVPTLGATFARLGYVAFAYDMVGYGDTLQLPHRFGGPREWLWGFSPVSVQLWHGWQALDFVSSLPDVDPERIGCTGASGGGTQTFLLAAVDPRVRVAAPVNMVSARFQGGCVCENAPNLRLTTHNIEIVACCAPRPLLLVCATGDWTKEAPAEVYPLLQQLYELYQARDRVACVQFDAPHNYHQGSREAVYAWFLRWMPPQQLPDQPALASVPPSQATGLVMADNAALYPEPPVQLTELAGPDLARLRMWPDRPLPPGAVSVEGVRVQVAARMRSELAARWPSDLAGLAAFRATYGPALQHALALSVVPAEAVQGRPAGAPEEREIELAAGSGRPASRLPCRVHRLALLNEGAEARVPAVLLEPLAGSAPAPGAALVLHPAGKAAALPGPGADPLTAGVVGGLLERGLGVLAVDPFLTGDYLTPMSQTGRATGRQHFVTYNRTDTALRVQDVVTALAYLRQRYPGRPVALLATGLAALWALLAAAFNPPTRLALEVALWPASGEEDEAYLAHLFVPLLRVAGDLPTALALLAPVPLWAFGAGPAFPEAAARQLYTAAGQPSALTVTGPRRPTASALAGWLVKWV